MKVLVTSGGTSEHIDDVRVITNISTGKLGAVIADKFAAYGHEVIYLYGKRSVLPHEYVDQLVEVTSAQSAFEAMQRLVPQVDIVIHAMAVSDFGFKRDASVKLKSNDPDAFIDFLRDNIVINPKILKHIKEWNPAVKLVSFKFEVGQEHESLVAIARESMEKSLSDAVIANDKVEMNTSGEHIAYLLTAEGSEEKLLGKDAIAQALLSFTTGGGLTTENFKRAIAKSFHPKPIPDHLFFIKFKQPIHSAGGDLDYVVAHDTDGVTSYADSALFDYSQLGKDLLDLKFAGHSIPDQWESWFELTDVFGYDLKHKDILSDPFLRLTWDGNIIEAPGGKGTESYLSTALYLAKKRIGTNAELVESVCFFDGTLGRWVDA